MVKVSGCHPLCGVSGVSGVSDESGESGDRCVNYVTSAALYRRASGEAEGSFLFYSQQRVKVQCTTDSVCFKIVSGMRCCVHA